MDCNFNADIDGIAEDLIDAFDLTFEREGGGPGNPLIRWLDYRLRYIDPCPRKTIRSKDFDQRVPDDSRSLLNAFVSLSESGGNLNSFQTKTIKLNDTSGRKRQLRTDGLWADYGIHHAHLAELPTEEEFSGRSMWLVFFMVLPDCLALIDVRSHDESGIFQARDLVEKAIGSWPEFFSGMKINGAVALEREPVTDSESIKQLRKGGVTQLLEVNGEIYMPPGLGVTTASTSTRVTVEEIRVRRLIRHIEKAMSDPSGEVMVAAAKKDIADFTLSLRITPKGFLSIVSTEQNIPEMPFSLSLADGDARKELQRIILPPEWAGPRLVAYLQSKLAGLEVAAGES